MKIIISKTEQDLGRNAAKHVAAILNECIEKKGSARIVLSTGASQLSTFEALVHEKVDWSKVTMFHLDEYVDLPETHIASFRKYLKERFVEKVHPGAAHFVDGTKEGIAALTKELRSAPIDVGLIGIGENGHIAFNDPPADFEVDDAYIVVKLNDTCKKQQVGEGWFATVDDVPKEAVSMTVKQIMKCDRIVSIVPRAVKADAVAWTLSQPENNMVPATIMKKHPDFTLFVDQDSVAKAKLGDIVLPEGVVCEVEVR